MRKKLGLLCVVVCICIMPQATAEISTFGDTHYVFSDHGYASSKTLTLTLRGEMIDPNTLESVLDTSLPSAVFGVYAKAADGAYVPYPDPANPFLPMQITASATPTSVSLPLSVDLYLKQENIPEGYRSSYDADYYRPISLPEDVVYENHRTGIQGLRIALSQGGTQTEPSAFIPFQLIGEDRSYSLRTDTDGIATLFPIPAGAYTLMQEHAQIGYSILEPEMHITVPEDEIVHISITNAQNGSLTLSPKGQTIDEDMQSKIVPLERSYEVFDTLNQSYGTCHSGDTISLPATVQGAVYVLRAIDKVPTDGFPEDVFEHTITVISGKEILYEPVIQINKGVFRLSHVSVENQKPVSGGAFALYPENDNSAVLVFQSDENGVYTQHTPIDAGRYLLRMTYAASGYQYESEAVPVEIRPFFDEGSQIAEVVFQSKPAQKAYLPAPTVVTDIQTFPSLFETDAEFDFTLRTVSGAPEIADISIALDEPKMRGVQIVEMRQDGADLLAQRRLAIEQTEECLQISVSGTVTYTVYYAISPDESIPIALEDRFTVPVATFAALTERPKYALYGRILDGEGNPVAGFRVSRQDPTGGLLYEQTITDAFGAYAFFATSSNASIVYYPDPGYGIFENENGGDAILLPLKSIQGRVIDHDALGESMITLSMGSHYEIIPDFEGKFSVSSAFTDDCMLVANTPEHVLSVFEEKDDEILVHVYPAATVMGAVVDENSGMVVPGAIATIKGTTTDQTMTTDESGMYCFTDLFQDTYELSFTAPEGYLLAEDVSIQIALQAGERRMVKRINMIRPAVITGLLCGEDGTPMGGVPVTLQPLDIKTKTATDGTFIFNGLYADTYTVDVALPKEYVLQEDIAPVVLQRAGDQAEVSLSAVLSASIAGQVWNDASSKGMLTDQADGLQSAIVSLRNEAGEVIADMRTEADGLFYFDSLRPGMYQVAVELPQNMIFTEMKGETEPFINGVNSYQGASPILQLDSGEHKADLICGAVVSSTISGLLWQDIDQNGMYTEGEPFVQDVIVSLLQEGDVLHTTMTDTKGYYAFQNLRAGNYTLSVDLPETHAFSREQSWKALGGAMPKPEAQTADFAITIDPGDIAPVLNIAVLERVTLRARVWVDAEADGKDYGDSGVVDTPVRLLSVASDKQEFQTELLTDTDGYVTFKGLLPGDYKLEYKLPSDDWGFVSGIDRELDRGWASSQKLALQAGNNIGLVGAGIAKMGSIKGVAFTDADYDGICGDNEVGLSTKVLLYNDVNELVTSTTTAGTGIYAFDKILPGHYTVEFVLENGYRFTKNRPDAPSFNSNVLEQSGPVARTDSFFLPMGETLLLDVGAYPSSSVSGAVWEDLHNTGQFAAGNPPISGLNVSLINDDKEVASTVTDKNGQYKFDDLSPGIYLVRVELPDGIRFSTQTFTSGRANNIQQTEITVGKTPRFILPMGTQKTNVDAGAIYPGTLKGKVLSPEMEGVKGVQVTVMRNQDIYAEAVTADDGSYLLENLRSGDVSLHFTAPDGWLFEENQTGVIPFTIPQGKTAEDVNITLHRETVIEGSVWLDENANGVRDANEEPLVGAVVALSQHKNRKDVDGVIRSITGTDVNGKYRFEGLQPGLYSLRIVPPEFTYLYSGNAIATEMVNLNIGETVTCNAPAFMAGYIRGKAWEDYNNDGEYTSDEPPLSEVKVQLRNEAGEVVLETVTDSDGNYLFNELPPLRFSLRLIPPVDYLIAEPEGGSVFDSKGMTPLIELAMGDMKNNMNAPMLRLSSIGDLIWLDQNANGLQDTSEPGMPAIQVALYRVVSGNLQFVSDTKTDDKGRYRFDNIIPGKYQLSFTVGDYLPTSPVDDLNQINSKLPWISKSTINTETFTVLSGIDELSMDVGLVTHDIAENLRWKITEDGNIMLP